MLVAYQVIFYINVITTGNVAARVLTLRGSQGGVGWVGAGYKATRLITTEKYLFFLVFASIMPSAAWPLLKQELFAIFQFFFTLEQKLLNM